MTVAWWNSERRPKSVHGLMALWGGFSEPKKAADCCLEKRLELDLVQSPAISTITVKELETALAHAGESLVQHSSDKGLQTLKFGRSLLLLAPNRMVISTTTSVMLHTVVRPLLELLHTHNITVEWASFTRVNYASPWTTATEISDIMAQEYAELKSVFPSGHPYLTGPVDRSHFFIFVYDGINRVASDPRPEEDVQLNVYMYNVQLNKMSYEANEPSEGLQSVISYSATEYETLRVSSVDASGPFATFETNVARAAKASTTLISDLLGRYRPEYATVLVLQDSRAKNPEVCSVSSNLNGYNVVHRGASYFGGNYVLHQVMFTQTA
ncbi:putative Adenosylmethionine decarboxylase [Trypanosoma vivax]|uniref:S-adenosylmethionine decarboxylase regulator n=1 Tax=Trypanosoma vivax (strain Y486) TaxID=1055687 RepID=G0TXA5_TRYVY|nr:S-adenosylmethionine decarboxylase regulator [Trypanosoma vivax]KAH8613830.1 putative Adenosylmethionine decarboxylase [Trypanosoma vivax]CCC48595.1 S-adenosylmethionine decarboxylase regulator [Trypanosoma vivax Y486]